MGSARKVEFGSPDGLAVSAESLGQVNGKTHVDPGALKQLVNSIISERRRRAEFFPGKLFADPAWDILLALAHAQGQQHRLTVSQLCARVDVPATTALRWITWLTDDGLLIRRDDMTDRRRKYIELSPAALAAMIQYCFTSRNSQSLAA